MPAQRFGIKGFKGLNQGKEPHDIEDGQFAVLENFYPKDGILKMRDGLTEITTSTAASEALNNLQSYRKSDGTWRVMASGATRIWITNAAGSSLSAISGGTFTSSSLPWSMKQYGDIMYLARDTAGTIQRADESTVSSAGIAAPTVAATIADGGAGVLVAGDYFVVYTFARADVNGNVLSESNQSPVSAVLTLAANRQISVTGIGVSTQAGINQRRLYITIANQTGQYFFAVSIENNVATTATINVTQANLGDPVSTNNGLPPTNIDYIELFNERMWASDGIDVFFSEDGLPESWGDFSVINVNKNDGFTVNGLKAFGERLIVGKTRGIYYITGEDESTFQRRQLSDKHGVVSHHSMAVAEGRCFWFGGDNFYYTDGQSVHPIGDVHVRDFIDNILPANYKTVTAAIDARKGWYMASAISGGTRQIAVYNYRSGDWTIFTYNAGIGAPVAFGDFADTNNQPVIYCVPSVTSGRIYNLNTGSRDGTFSISYQARTKSFDFGSSDTLKFLTGFLLLVDSDEISESVTFAVRRDSETTAINSVSISIHSGHQWKRLSLPCLVDPGLFLNVTITYSGITRFVISSCGFDVVDTKRRPVAA